MLGPECTVRPIETWNKHRTVTVSNSIKQHRTASKSNSIEIEQHRTENMCQSINVACKRGDSIGARTKRLPLQFVLFHVLHFAFRLVVFALQVVPGTRRQQTFSTNHSVEVATRQYWCCTTAVQLLHNCYTTPLTKPHPSGAIPTFVLSPAASGRRCPPPSPAEHWSAG